jgi:hypothetical protein
VKILVTNILAVSGVALVTYGAWAAWRPAGPIVLGLMLMLAAVNLGTTKAK